MARPAQTADVEGPRREPVLCARGDRDCRVAGTGAAPAGWYPNAGRECVCRPLLVMAFLFYTFSAMERYNANNWSAGTSEKFLKRDPQAPAKPFSSPTVAG